MLCCDPLLIADIAELSHNRETLIFFKSSTYFFFFFLKYLTMLIFLVKVVNINYNQVEKQTHT